MSNMSVAFHWNQFLEDAVKDPHYVIMMIALLTGIVAFANYKTAGFPWTAETKFVHTFMTLGPLVFYVLTHGSMVFILLQVLVSTIEGAMLIYRVLVHCRKALKARVNKQV